MSESSMRGDVVRGLRHLDAMAVENRCLPGTPDVNYKEGWLELKWLRSWPVREDTPVLIDHYSKQQRLWLRRRWLAGGHAYLLLQVRREWLLFDGAVASVAVGCVSRAALHGAALASWCSGINYEELSSWLTRPRA